MTSATGAADAGRGGAEPGKYPTRQLIDVSSVHLRQVNEWPFKNLKPERSTIRGQRRVVLPRLRREGRPRAVRATRKWRTGCEERISAPKPRHGFRRCRYRGLLGMERWVGLGVTANDLLVLGRAGSRTG